MKILTLVGLLVLLTTSPTIKCIPGQFKPSQIPHYFPAPLAGSNAGFGPNLGFLALAIIVFSILLVPSPKCPTGYTLYSDKCGRFCYRLHFLICKSWADARATCKAEGADLMEPEKCSYPFFQGIAPQSGAKCSDYWIGSFRTPPSTGYMTLKGNPIPDNFQFWGNGEPSRMMQTCVEMADELGYAMNDDNCGELGGYICQKFI